MQTWMVLLHVWRGWHGWGLDRGLSHRTETSGHAPESRVVVPESRQQRCRNTILHNVSNAIRSNKGRHTWDGARELSFPRQDFHAQSIFVAPGSSIIVACPSPVIVHDTDERDGVRLDLRGGRGKSKLGP